MPKEKHATGTTKKETFQEMKTLLSTPNTNATNIKNTGRKCIKYIIAQV